MVAELEEIKATLILEERMKRLVQAALNDEQFMKDVREAQQLEVSGDKGEPWPQVKARLDLV